MRKNPQKSGKNQNPHQLLNNGRLVFLRTHNGSFRHQGLGNPQGNLQWKTYIYYDIWKVRRWKAVSKQVKKEELVYQDGRLLVYIMINGL